MLIEVKDLKHELGTLVTPVGTYGDLCEMYKEDDVKRPLYEHKLRGAIAALRSGYDRLRSEQPDVSVFRRLDPLIDQDMTLLEVREKVRETVRGLKKQDIYPMQMQ